MIYDVFRCVKLHGSDRIFSVVVFKLYVWIKGPMNHFINNPQSF